LRYTFHKYANASAEQYEETLEPKPRELKVYESSPGVKPFDDWLDELRDGQGRTIIRIRLDRLEKGNFGACKSVDTAFSN